MAKQKSLFAVGDTFTTKGEKLEVIHVSSKFKGDEPFDFQYEVRLHSEMVAKRKADAESAKAETERLQQEADDAARAAKEAAGSEEVPAESEPTV